MPSKQKILGMAGERQLVEQAHKKGVKATKQPLSGVLKSHPNDVVLEDSILVESKVRAFELDGAGEKSIRIPFDWFFGVDSHSKAAGYEFGMVVVRPKGSPRRLAMLDFEAVLDLIAKAKGGQDGTL